MNRFIRKNKWNKSMKHIATLGPKGTYSDIATEQYLSNSPEMFTTKYYNSFKSIFAAIGTDCDQGVLPIENFSEGFVQIVLDLLAYTDLEIIQEISLPVNFSFIANTEDSKDIKTLYVQYVAKGQCSEFIENIGNVEIVSTESNAASFETFMKQTQACGAIVPNHVILGTSLSLVLNNVNDYPENQTRFIVLAKKSVGKIAGKTYKTSLLVKDDKNYPGLLVDILSSFSKRHIDLYSIISRPTKRQMGKYHFFIDIDGYIEDRNVRESIEEISNINKVQILGSYPKSV
jgi:prephenate dehydratase